MRISRKIIYLLIILTTILFNCSEGKSKRKRIPINSLEDVMTNLAPIPKTFEINPAEETVLKGDKGTAIYIPAGAFQFEDGTTPTGKINIELKECYSLTDMISENLQTTSMNQILETAGMIYINATADGKQLSVKKDKALVVGFPKNNTQDTMDLFYQTKLDDSSSTWIPDYLMFQYKEPESITNVSSEQPTGGQAYPDSIEYGIDSSYSISYPIEMTDDLYMYSFRTSSHTATFIDLKLLGYNGSILDYIDDPTKADTAIAREFAINNWTVHFLVYIDKNGKLNNFRVEKDEWTNYNDRAVKLAEKFLRTAPAFNLKDYSEEVKHDFDYTLGITSDKVIDWDKFKAKFKQKYSAFTDKAVEKIEKGALDYYLLSVTKMGWINCDRFWDVQDDEKVDFIVKTQNPKDTKIQIVFNDIKGLMNGTFKDGQIVFSDVPINKKIKVIGISYSNGKPTMGMAETTIGKSSFELTGFKEFSLDQLETELNKLK